MPGRTAATFSEGFAVSPKSPHNAAVSRWQFATVALIAFLTLVDLFAAQAIVPSLAMRFGASPSTIGVAVNLSTLGMAAAALVVAAAGRRIETRTGVWVSLAALSVPTTLLAFTDSLAAFAFLRVLQGVFMVAAFTLTMAWIGGRFTGAQTALALSAYVTGNVASNVFGRMLSAWSAEQFGISGNFLLFAALNLCGAVLAYATLRKTAAMMESGRITPAADAPPARPIRRELIQCFALGFLLLFVFIGTFTYVNFHLTSVLGLSAMALGGVYLIFLPSLVTTWFAGSVADRLGVRSASMAALSVALAGLALGASASLPVVLAGLALVAAGTFQAQAIVTGHVSRIAPRSARARASGLYLASYYGGGLAGSFAVGRTYDYWGWNGCILVMAVATVSAMALSPGRIRNVPDNARASELSATGIGRR
jgi:predicted MFS family arabinose efflux permease